MEGIKPFSWHPFNPYKGSVGQLTVIFLVNICSTKWSNKKNRGDKAEVFMGGEGNRGEKEDMLGRMGEGGIAKGSGWNGTWPTSCS